MVESFTIQTSAGRGRAALADMEVAAMASTEAEAAATAQEGTAAPAEAEAADMAPAEVVRGTDSEHVAPASQSSSEV